MSLSFSCVANVCILTYHYVNIFFAQLVSVLRTSKLPNEQLKKIWRVLLCTCVTIQLSYFFVFNEIVHAWLKQLASWINIQNAFWHSTCMSHDRSCLCHADTLHAYHNTYTWICVRTRVRAHSLTHTHVTSNHFKLRRLKSVLKVS